MGPEKRTPAERGERLFLVKEGNKGLVGLFMGLRKNELLVGETTWRRKKG